MPLSHSLRHRRSTSMRSAGRGKVATGEDGSKVTVRARGEVAIAQAAGAAVGQDRRAVGLAVWSAVGAVAVLIRGLVLWAGPWHWRLVSVNVGGMGVDESQGARGSLELCLHLLG